MNLELQKFLFEKKPSRIELLNYEPISKNKYKIFVFRNHSFELIENTISAYLDFAELSVEFNYGGYDDSLTFQELDASADMIIVWIDTTRYKHTDIKTFIENRLSKLMSMYSKPILFIPFGQEINFSDKRVITYSLKSIQNMLEEKFVDMRMSEFTGTALSNKAMLLVSKELGLKYIPAMLRPLLKAIIVDLDNTLYEGVLGEDGIDGISITEGHINLQKWLKMLSKKGFFLCIASKNNDEDVRMLIKNREDFILKENDFTKICASWNSKADSVEEIAKFLNINSDSMLFIDDNIGELMSMNMAYPNIKLIQAYDNADLTADVLSNYPGMLKLNIEKEDSLRMNDVKANEERNNLRQKLSPQDYIRSLELKLNFDFKNKEQATRVCQLANKTNQFIFNYKRYTQGQVDEMMSDPSSVIVTISLSDKLSDSGLVGVCIGKNKGDFVEIEEFFISCRALGRGIDDIIVLGAIRGATEYFHRDRIKVDFLKGERNEPAERFVDLYLHDFLENDNQFRYKLPENLVEIEYRGI